MPPLSTPERRLRRLQPASGRPKVEDLPPSTATLPQACGVLLDLCYGAVAWRELRRRWLRGEGEGGGDGDSDGDGAGDGEEPRVGGGAAWRPSATAPLLYVNCGGHEGLPGMLRRYARLGLLREGETPESMLEEAEEACRATELL